MALGTREMPILLDEDEDEDFTFLSGPSKLLVKRFTPITRALSLAGQPSSSSIYLRKNIGNDNAIVLDDTDDLNTSGIPANLGGRLRATCETMYKSVRFKADSSPISRSLKRKCSGEDLQSHGLRSLPLDNYVPTNSDPFGGLSKNQRKRLRKRLRSEGAMMASAVQTTAPRSPMHGLVSGFTAAPSSTSLGQSGPSTELTPYSPSVSDSDGVSIVNLPPRNGGPERATYVGPNWPTHVKKCSNTFIPGPGLGPLAGGTSMPMNVHNASAAGMPPNVYGSSACTIGKRVYLEPSSGRFPSSENLTVLHDPNRTLILEKLPKRFRSIDFVVQWCRDTAREDDPAPLYIDVVRTLGKALIEFTTQERAELAFNSPRLMNADGRTQICAFWFRPDSSDRHASTSSASVTSGQLSSATSITAPQEGELTQPAPSGCSDPVSPNEEQVADAVTSSTSYARPICTPPSTLASASADEVAETTGTGVRSRGINTVPSSDRSDDELDLRTEAGQKGDDDKDSHRKALDEESDETRPSVPEGVVCELKDNSRKVSPSPSNEGMSILQDEPKTQILDQERSSPEFEESADLLVSSVPLSEEQEVTILLMEEDDEDVSFGREGSPQLMYPNSDDREFDSPSASGQQLTPKVIRKTPPNSVLGGYVAAYESSPVRGGSPETTKSSTEEHQVSSHVQKGPVRPITSCKDEERSRSMKAKRMKSSKQAARKRKTYVTRSRFKGSLKASDQRKRPGRLKAPRKRKLKASTDTIPSSLRSTDEDISIAGVGEAFKQANRDAFTCNNGTQGVETLREDVTVDADLAPVYDIGRPSISSINRDETASSDLTPLPSSSACASPRAETDGVREDEREGPQVPGDDILEIFQVPSDPMQHLPGSLVAMPAAGRSALPCDSDDHGQLSPSLSEQEKRNAQLRPAMQIPVRITRSKGAVKTCSKLVSETYIVVPVTEATTTSECVSANGPSSSSIAEGAEIGAEGNAPEPDRNSQILTAITQVTGVTEVEETAMSSAAIQLESSEDDPQQVQPPDMATVTDDTAVPITEGCSPETKLQLERGSQSSQSGALVNEFPLATSVNVPVFSSPFDPALIESQCFARGQGSTANNQYLNEAHAGPLPENGIKNVNGASTKLTVITHTPVSNPSDFPSPSALSTASQPDKTGRDAGTQSCSPETKSLPLSNGLAAMPPPSSHTADCLRLVRSTSVASDASKSGLNILPVELEWIVDGGSLHPDLVVQNWSLQELQEGRRIVRFTHKLSGNKLHVSCEVIPPGQVSLQEDNVISCVYRAETQDRWITSVDLIRLLQGLVGEIFEVEEKNRLRRNFESFKPLTVSKSSPDHGAFYQRLIQFPQPRPISIEKDVKVFSWSQFVPIISKVFSKYSLLGPASSPPVQTSGEMNQPAPSSATTSHPFLAAAIEILQQSPRQPANYQDVPEHQLTLLREHASNGGKQMAIATTVNPRDLTGNNAISAPIPQWPASPLLVDSSSGSTASLFSSSEPTSSSVTSLADTALQRSASYFDSLASAFLQDVLGPLQSDAPPISLDEPTKRANFSENVSESVPIDPMLLLLDRQHRLEEHLAKSKALLAQWESTQDKSEKARIMALIKEERRDFEARQTAADTEIKSMEAGKLNRHAVSPKTKKAHFKRWPQTQYDQLVIPLSDNEGEDDELVADG